MERSEVFAAILDHYLLPVAPYRKNEEVAEIMINGPDEVYIEAGGRLEKTSTRFADEDTLVLIARNLALYNNKRLTASTASFDARLPDGSRGHVVLPRCSRRGLCISIRKFATRAYTLEDLVKMGSISDAAKEYIEIVIAIECNMIVAGGTGTGKTSILNALSREIPEKERIIVIEDTSELRLEQPHVLSFETAEADRKGRGAVAIRDLFRSALRMRPDRIIIGECRGAEALDLVQALTSGHGGSLSTLHANSAADALRRLETMALMGKVRVPLFALRPQIVSAIHSIVHLARLPDGRRIVQEIAEVNPHLSGGAYKVETVFARNGDPGQLTAVKKVSRFREAVMQKGFQKRIHLNQSLFALN